MTVLRSGVSTMVNGVAGKTTLEYKSTRSTLLVKDPTAYGFLQFGLPSDLRKGATVLTATLRITQDKPLTGSRTLTVRPVASKWLLSTINWANRPGVTGTAHAVTQAGSTTVWTFDVVADIQAWVNGTTPNYGWRIVTDDATGFYVRGFQAATGKPTLEITYAYVPAAPTGLHPSAGAVSVAKPVLQWDGGAIAAAQVQIDPAANGTTPAFDSGTVATTVNQLDLATTAYAGLASGASTQWRSRVTNSAGMVSPWSKWATFSRVAKPALTITQPTGTVWEASPPINWTMAGQVAYQVLVARSTAPTKILYDSGKVASTTQEHTPPKAVYSVDGASYVTTVRAWDAVDREATYGDPNYSEAKVTSLVDTDPAVAGVTWVDAVQADLNAPWVDLKWSRAVMPDGWAIRRDGRYLATIASANDVLASGNIYTWRDWTAAPNREHFYEVRPVVNGVTSRNIVRAYVTPRIAGIWLADPETGLSLLLFGVDDAQLGMADDATVYQPIGASAPVRVVTGLRGYEGTVTGTLENAWDLTPTDQVAALSAIKSAPTTTYRLATGDLNIPVAVGDLSWSPIRRGVTEEGNRQAVSFSVWQTGEYPFETL